METLPQVLNIIGIITILTGLLLSIFHIMLIVKNSTSSYWVECIGTILDAKLDINSNVFNEKHERYYNAKIAYRYTINAKEYISTRVFFGDYIYSLTPSKQTKILGKYPKGKIVPIFYNPKKPDSSVIEKGFRIENVYSLIGSSVIAFLGYLLIYKIDLILQIIHNFLSLGQNN